MTTYYAKLRGKITEKGFTMKEFSGQIGISYQSFSNKLNKKNNFDCEEIDSICSILGIPRSKIGTYFFDSDVKKTKEVESGTNN